MQATRQFLANLLKIAACAVLILGANVSVQAAEGKADPTGTWTWSRPGRDGETRTTTLKLKREGDKITGTVSGFGRQGGQANDTAIEEGKIKGDVISFVVNREFNGNKFTMKYHGKISGDSIKGQIEFDRNGETQSRDWEAKRKEDKGK